MERFRIKIICFDLDNVIRKTKAQGYAMTFKQLKKWNIKFNKLIFGKPSYDLFIDDKSIYFNSKWHENIDKLL